MSSRLAAKNTPKLISLKPSWTRGSAQSLTISLANEPSVHFESQTRAQAFWVNDCSVWLNLIGTDVSICVHSPKLYVSFMFVDGGWEMFRQILKTKTLEIDVKHLSLAPYHLGQVKPNHGIMVQNICTTD